MYQNRPLKWYENPLSPETKRKILRYDIFHPLLIFAVLFILGCIQKNIETFLLALLGPSLVINAILLGRMRYPIKLGLSHDGIWYITLRGVLVGKEELIPWENIKSIKLLKVRQREMYELFFRSRRGFPLTIPVNKEVAPIIESAIDSYFKREQK